MKSLNPSTQTTHRIVGFMLIECSNFRPIRALKNEHVVILLGKLSFKDRALKSLNLEATIFSQT